jgi:hypothetical protein
MPKVTHLQTLGDASSYAAFTNKVRINFFFMVLQFFAYYLLRSSFFSHNILDPIEGDDWTKVIIIAAAAGNNNSTP